LRRYGYSKFDISGGVHLGPILSEGEVVRGHRSYPWKERWWFSIRSLLIVVIALSLTIRPQFAIECVRRSIQQGQNVRMFPLK